MEVTLTELRQREECEHNEGVMLSCSLLLNVTLSHLTSKELPRLHFICSSASQATYEM